MLTALSARWPKGTFGFDSTQCRYEPRSGAKRWEEATVTVDAESETSSISLAISFRMALHQLVRMNKPRLLVGLCSLVVFRRLLGASAKLGSVQHSPSPLGTIMILLRSPTSLTPDAGPLPLFKISYIADAEEPIFTVT